MAKKAPAKEANPKTKPVPPKRQKGETDASGKVIKPFPFNDSRRPREYLTLDEVERLCAAAASEGRHPKRDEAMIWVAFFHGLRVSELVGLKIEKYDFTRRILHVDRNKKGTPSVHGVDKKEFNMIKKLVGERRSGYVFLSERGEPLSTNNFCKIVRRAGLKMKMPGQKEPGWGFQIHPHMLRHACGYYWTEKGMDIRVIQAWLGHKNINHTVKYTALSPAAFAKFTID